MGFHTGCQASVKVVGLQRHRQHAGRHDDVDVRVDQPGHQRAAIALYDAALVAGVE